MRVSEIGEFGLIRLLAREVGAAFEQGPSRPGLLVDIGDDAVVTAGEEGALVWTTDTMVAGVHFLAGLTPWRNVGWKAIAVNVSDVAAMGARPKLALVTLCLPPESCVEDLLELYRGMKDCCEEFHATIGGGDVVRAPVFAVTVALSGQVELAPEGAPRVLRRSAARPGDVVAVTGTLGDSAAGLRLLQSGADRRDPSNAALIAAQERPRPRVEAGLQAVAAGVECGMDVSDGLVQDLGHICAASGVAARINEDRLPLSAELRRAFPEEALELALSGGEDYELLLCARSEVIASLEAAGLDLTPVGEIVAGPPSVRVVGAGGVERAAAVGGWDHLRGGPAA